jgi:hypothetical protein
MLAHKTPLDVKLALHNYNRKYRFIPIPKGGQVSSEEMCLFQKVIYTESQNLLHMFHKKARLFMRGICIK